jgi:hypothetical protein
LLAFVYLAQVLFAGASGSAQELDGAGDEPSGYREMVGEAIQEFAAGNYQESLALFHRAHQLYPNARTYRGLGFAEFELRHYDSSVRYLEAALASTVKPLTPDLRRDSERILARANNFVARVQLNAKPSKVRLSVDGGPAEETPNGLLLLAVGDHTLSISAPGFVSQTRHMRIQGGEHETLTVLLTPAPATEEKAPARTTSAWYKSPWLWGSLGVLVAGAAAGASVALTRDDPTASSYGGSSGTVLKGP